MSVNYIEGKRPCPEGRFGIVVSRFNSFITERLLEGALDTLKRDGEVKDENITVIRVPGALEIPLTVKPWRWARSSSRCRRCCFCRCIIGETWWRASRPARLGSWEGWTRACSMCCRCCRC